MGYKVDYGALDNLMNAYSSAVSSWNSGISSVKETELAIETSQNISGNSADRMREYLRTTYICASSMLTDLFDMFLKTFLVYMKAYNQQIDSANEVSITQAELSDRRTSLQEKRSKLQQIGLAAENTVSKVADLVSTPSLDISDVDAECAHVLTLLDDLDDAVNGLERTHVNADFQEIDELISRLDAFFREMYGLNKEFKTAFTLAGFTSLASVPAMISAYDAAMLHMQAMEPEIKLATEDYVNRLKQKQAEMEERERQAKIAKIGTTILIGAVSAAAIVVFPAFAPVIGMTAGIITSTVSAATDEYVKNGTDFGNWDTARIGTHACIGAVTGLISGCVPPGTGFVVKAGVKGLSSALEGAATSTYDQVSTYGRIADTKAIVVDSVEKGGSSFVGSLIGGAISDSIKTTGISSLDLAKNDPLNKMHGLSVFLFEGGKSAGTGIIKRGVSNLTGQVITLSSDGTPVRLNEIDLLSVRDEMFSAESIGSDFVGSGLSGATSDYVELRTPDPDTGLTPIIQFKLGNTPDPETGTAPIIDESLKKLENKEHWEHTHLTDWHTTDWENTSSSPEEILIMEEMEQKGDLGVISINPNLADPVHNSTHIPKTAGVFLSEPGNSEFRPNDSAIRKLIGEYSRETVDYINGEPDFSPFAVHDSPWGKIDCQVEIGHMTDQRENPPWEFGRRPNGTSHDPAYDLGNYAQADNSLLEIIHETNPDATIEDVVAFRKDNNLTWHETADGKTMQLVPTKVNAAFPHSGGVSEMEYRMAWGDITRPTE